MLKKLKQKQIVDDGIYEEFLFQMLAPRLSM